MKIRILAKQLLVHKNASAYEAMVDVSYFYFDV